MTSQIARNRARTVHNYNRLSRWYDGLAGRAEKKYRHLGLQALDPRAGERILEIGFGTGQCILVLAKAVGQGGKVCGIDISQGMLAVAEKRLRKAGIGEWVDLRIGDAVQLSFEPGSFDAVFMSFVLELFDAPEVPLVLGECRQVLRPGGRIGLVAMALPDKPGIAVRLYEWFHARWPALVDCRPILVREALREAGFIIESAQRLKMWGLPVDVILGCKP